MMSFSRIRAATNVVLFLVLLSGLLTVYGVVTIVAPSWRSHVPVLFFRGCLHIIGIRVCRTGHPNSKTVMYVANHVSYLDILVLGALIGDGVFVAKKEVSSWPLFGYLARLVKTVFIERNPRQARHQNQRLRERMNKDIPLIIFPEGTSTDGSYVEPFKGTPFASMDDMNRESWVQPVTIAYARDKKGRQLSQKQRDTFAWFGDQTLLPHLWRIFGTRGCEVQVLFHNPINYKDFSDRKAAARACQKLISESLVLTLGQPLPCYDVTVE